MPTAPKRFTFGPERKAWSHGKQTTTQRGYGWQHQKARERLFKRDPLCRECSKHGIATVATVADHIINLAAGGTQSDDNLQPLCAPCHQAKTLREAQQARQRR